jgi:hypothetical protein
MKKLFSLLLLLCSLQGLAQTTLTGDRVVARQSLYLRDWWVDSIGRDTAFSGKTRVVPSADAVHRFVEGRLAGFTPSGGTTAWADIAGKPTTLSGYGITDPIVLTSGSYANPSWLTSLDYAKLTGVPASLPSQTGNAGKVLTTDGSNASWANPTITTSSATSLTLGTSYETYVFTGSSATTWTLPAISGDTGRRYFIKNRGTANITLQRAGSDQLYTTMAVTSITIYPGDGYTIQNDNTYWIVL